MYNPILMHFNLNTAIKKNLLSNKNNIFYFSRLVKKMWSKLSNFDAQMMNESMSY